MILQENSIRRKAGVTCFCQLLLSDITDFKIKKVTGDKDGHFIMGKGTIHQENITLLNIHASNQGARKYTKQQLTELKGETAKSTTIVGDLKTH